MQNNSDVDVNVLVTLYNKKLSTISNQNVLLEAKLETLKKDFLSLQEQYENLMSSSVSLEKGETNGATID
tara:strand:- start:3548 stop:3757 length:210 start_codon:yes stop_codon:yes gene_type:complete